jgi:hypothetical protein
MGGAWGYRLASLLALACTGCFTTLGIGVGLSKPAREDVSADALTPGRDVRIGLASGGRAEGVYSRAAGERDGVILTSAKLSRDVSIGDVRREDEMRGGHHVVAVHYDPLLPAVIDPTTKTVFVPRAAMTTIEESHGSYWWVGGLIGLAADLAILATVSEFFLPRSD